MRSRGGGAHLRWTMEAHGAEALGSAYVRFSMYDVRLPNLRALRGEEAADAAHVRGTTYDVRLESSRALRGGAERKQCALMKLCAECGVAFVVASAVGLWYNPARSPVQVGGRTRSITMNGNSTSRAAVCSWCLAHPWHVEQLVYLAFLALYRL